MPSSTSSSESVTPARPLGRIWLVTLLAALLGLCALEGFWRMHGYKPNLPDSTEFWAVHRDRASDGEGRTVVLLGDSRMALDFAPDVFYRRFPDLRLVDLAVDGAHPLASFKDLAEDANFHGTVICDLTEEAFGDQASVEQQPWVHYYHKDFRLNTCLNAQISGHLHECLTFLNPQLNPLWSCWGWVQNRCLPVDYLQMVYDRSRRADYGKLDIQEHRAKRVAFRKASTQVPSSAEFERNAQLLEDWARRIIARGGKVAFVRFPTTDESWALDEKQFPREAYWDRFAGQTVATAIHFHDYPSLSCFECPDTSHLDYRDALPFTDALLSILVNKGVLGEAVPDARSATTRLSLPSARISH